MCGQGLRGVLRGREMAGGAEGQAGGRMRGCEVRRGPVAGLVGRAGFVC